MLNGCNSVHAASAGGAEAQKPSPAPYAHPSDISHLSHAQYRALLEGPSPQLPAGLELPPRWALALQRSLEIAFSQEERVRRLIVLARAFVINKALPAYAADVGLKSHSYLRIEQRGFIAGQSVPAVFGVLVRDWQRRIDQGDRNTPFFKWAQRELLSRVVASHYGTAVGQILEWNVMYGLAEVSERTGVPQATIANWRLYGRNLSFGELVSFGERLRRDVSWERTEETWDTSWVRRARRIYFHESVRLGRSPVATKLHMILEWANIAPGLESLGRAFPSLTQDTISRIIRFQPVPLGCVRDICAHSAIKKGVPQLTREALYESARTESMRVGDRLQSARLVSQMMKAQGITTQNLSRLFEVHDPARPKAGTAIVRRVITELSLNEDVPWKGLAAVVARSRKDYEKLLASRGVELAQGHVRRVGQELRAERLERMLLGARRYSKNAPVEDKGSARLGLENFLRVVAEVDLSKTFDQLRRFFGQEVFRSNASGSDERIHGFIHGDRAPSWPEYQRYLKGVRVTPLICHELGWRHAFGSSIDRGRTMTPYGRAQRRVIETLITEGAEDRTNFFRHRGYHAGRFARYARELSEGRQIPSVKFSEFLEFAGIAPASARRHTIRLIVDEKDFSRAIVRWYSDRLVGTSALERSDLLRLLGAGRSETVEALRELPTEDHERLSLRHAAGGSLEDIPWLRRRREVVTLMRYFPGVTLDEVSAALNTLRLPLKELEAVTSLPATWTPKFQSYGDRLLEEQGFVFPEQECWKIIPKSLRESADEVWKAVEYDQLSGRTILRSIFPTWEASHLPQMQLLKAPLQKLLLGSLATINVNREEATTIARVFAKLFEVAPTVEDSALVVGYYLERQRDHLQSTDTKITVAEALERIFSLLRIARRH